MLITFPGNCARTRSRACRWLTGPMGYSITSTVGGGADDWAQTGVSTTPSPRQAAAATPCTRRRRLLHTVYFAFIVVHFEFDWLHHHTRLSGTPLFARPAW